jgi:hypothetical protein
MQAYNVFRSNRRDGLLCAVPEARSVPAFLTGPRWVFSGKIDREQPTPLGFDARAAAAGVRLPHRNRIDRPRQDSPGGDPVAAWFFCASPRLPWKATTPQGSRSPRVSEPSEARVGHGPHDPLVAVQALVDHTVDLVVDLGH